METKLFVMEAYRYKESGKWEYSLKGMYDTLEEAKPAFHARCNAIMKNTNDFAMVVIVDSFGNRIQSDYVDTHEEASAASE